MEKNRVDLSVQLLYASGMKPLDMDIHRLFRSIITLTRELESSPRRFGTDQLLSHAEVHLIEIIGDHEDISVTDIAKCLGITKGAVSQSLKRLEAKGFSTKRPDPANLSRSLVELRSKGETAYHAHKRWHETMDGGFARYMAELDPGELSVIVRFLTRVEDFLRRRAASEA